MTTITKLARMFTRSLTVSSGFLRPLTRPTTSLTSNRVAMEQRNCFSTTPKRNVIPPLVWLIAKPLTKLSAIIVGRGFRQWWQSLPKNKRTLLKLHLVRNKLRYFLITGSSVGGSVCYYQSHIQETPITHRRRFILFTLDQLMEVENLEKNQSWWPLITF